MINQDFIKVSILLLVIDYVFLKLISKHFNNQVSLVQGEEITMDYYGAGLSYLFLIIGLKVFILDKNASLKEAFILGLIIYGVYEATTKALLKNWKWETVLIDSIWGGVLFTLTTYLYRKI